MGSFGGGHANQLINYDHIIQSRAADHLQTESRESQFRLDNSAVVVLSY